MPYDFSSISPLSMPIQTTGNDVVLSGHGLYDLSGETIIPAGVELWVLAPPGSLLSDATGGALEHMDRITKLAVVSPKTKALSPVTPTRYAAGSKAPNYTLTAPRGLDVRPNGPHILGVESRTYLDALWARVQVFVKPGAKVRVFWACCAELKGQQQMKDDEIPTVVHV